MRVIGKKKISNPNPDTASFMYYITDGVYGSFNMVLHGMPPRVPPVVIRVWASSGLVVVTLGSENNFGLIFRFRSCLC